VPAHDQRVARITDISDVEPLLLEEIAHFFTVYKDVEPGK
jgi:inorganic pyrophosphatase